MKIGLDFHGVIDSSPELFRVLTRLLLYDDKEDNQVHIITGLSKKDADKKKEYKGILYTHFYSITDDLEQRGKKTGIDSYGRPCFDKKDWDMAKAIYCKEHKIDLMIDDTERYKKYFETPFILWKK